MTIAIPSDLVLDVMRNAVSARADAARAKLTMAGPVSAGTTSIFSGILNGVSRKATPSDDLIAGVLDAADSDKATAAATRITGFSQGVELASSRVTQSPQVAFEQMVLRNMFESMLPAADSGIYGEENASSGVWRSLAADQLATTYVNAGGLGIATSLTRAEADGPVSRGQWPYFEQPVLNGFAS
jgi:hypothetical protein